MSVNPQTTVTVYGTDESTTERELPLEDLVEQHAGATLCANSSCFSSEEVVFLSTGDGEYRPVCRDCRDRHGVEL